MIKLKYNDWSEISIKKFDEIKKSLKRNSNNELESNLELLSILCDVSVEEIEDLPLTEFSRLLKQTDFMAKMPKIDVKEKYVINGRQYNVCLNVNKMTTAQYIDYQTFGKDIENNLKNIIAVFMIPEGKKYGDYDLEEVIDELYNNMPIADAYSVCFFFTLQLQSLTKATLYYLERKIKKEMKKEKNKMRKEKITEGLEQIQQVKHLLNDGAGYIW